MHSKVVNPSDFKLCFGNVGLNDPKPKPLGREASVNWCIGCSYWLLAMVLSWRTRHLHAGRLGKLYIWVAWWVPSACKVKCKAWGMIAWVCPASQLHQLPGVQFPLVPMYIYSYAAHSWCSCTCYCSVKITFGQIIQTLLYHRTCSTETT